MGSGEDEVGQRRDGDSGDIEPCAEVAPEADAELGAGLQAHDILLTNKFLKS